MSDPLEESPEAPSRFGRLLGYRLTVWRDAYAEVELTLGPDHLNRAGAPHGGVLATLIDTACGYAGCYCSVPGRHRGAVTVSLNTHFIARARTGDRLTAAAHQTAAGRRLYFARCDVRDQTGRLVAQGEGVFRYRPGSERPEGEPAEPENNRTGPA